MHTHFLGINPDLTNFRFCRVAGVDLGLKDCIQLPMQVRIKREGEGLIDTLGSLPQNVRNHVREGACDSEKIEDGSSNMVGGHNTCLHLPLDPWIVHSVLENCAVEALRRMVYTAAYRTSHKIATNAALLDW